jgi:hypothetical protein
MTTAVNSSLRCAHLHEAKIGFVACTLVDNAAAVAHLSGPSPRLRTDLSSLQHRDTVKNASRPLRGHVGFAFRATYNLALA